jgi:hypothetical protein
LLTLSNEIRSFLSERGISSIFADSGNGYHLLVRIDLQANELSRSLVESLLKGLDAKFSNVQVGVDTTCFNEGRVCKIYGTVSRKGENTLERPWRVARLLDAPSVEVVSEERLRELLAVLPKEAAISKAAPRNEKNLYAAPHRYQALMREAGRIWNLGTYSRDLAVKTAVEWARENFEVVGEFKEDLVRKEVEHLFDTYKPGNREVLLTINGVLPGQSVTAPVSVSTITVDDLSWLDLGEEAVRPVFPEHVMFGTSLYENLARPICELNSKFPELIWMPAVQIMMNQMYGAVGYELYTFSGNMFLGIVSPPGKFFKSSSCKAAHNFCEQAGFCFTHNGDFGVSAGLRTVITQAGSSEGFGSVVWRLTTTASKGVARAIMFNDELGKLVAKINIENSSFASDMLSWKEHNSFANNTTTRGKVHFNFAPNTHCLGWLFCTTTTMFRNQWPRVAGIASGMLDRMFFLVTPKESRPITQERFVPLDWSQTKQRLDHAIIKGKYRLEISEEMNTKANQWDDPRARAMVSDFALYFAVDLGRETVDLDCWSRAVELVQYRQAAIAFLKPIEAKNEVARLTQEIVQEIRQHGGKMTRREFTQSMQPTRHGDTWNKAYRLLVNWSMIREFEEPGQRGQVKKMIGLVKEEFHSI